MVLVKTKNGFPNLLDSGRSLRLGFVPLLDCAPLAIAADLGLFRKYGLRVSLQRELGWASIRDKIIYGELEAAHALAAMPIAATLGLGAIPCDCVSALVLNVHGNAITLSMELRRRDVKDGNSLRQAILAERGTKTFTFGVVFPFSSHRHLLRKWLARHGIDPERDVRLAVVPPPQMVQHLSARHLDGFCVGEPWNSVAALAKTGWCAGTSAELDPGHPEKVLMVRRQFAEKRAEEHVALLAALLEACEFCDEPANRDRIVRVLARPEYVNVPAVALCRGLEGTLSGADGKHRNVPEFCVFHRNQANEPSTEKAAWALNLVRSGGLCPDIGAVNAELGRRVFRPDIHEQALRLRSSAAFPNDTTRPKKEHQFACT
jgi:ABC-type nitrate/sulfonate/bicarbonate transport system substrate-binding protein